MRTYIKILKQIKKQQKQNTKTYNKITVKITKYNHSLLKKEMI